MIGRLVLVAMLLASSAYTVQAQSPFEFLRRQREREAPPPPRPQQPQRTSPARPATPKPAVPAQPAAAAAPAAPAAPTGPLPPPPYEKDVRRIGEILGALHYLRPLCGADDGPVWRDKMQALIEAEGGPIDRRERLAGAFNQGYTSFQTTYRTCTPAADLAVRRYLAEGAKLTREIATRHGN